MLAVIMAIENEDDRLFVETVFNRYAKSCILSRTISSGTAPMPRIVFRTPSSR